MTTNPSKDENVYFIDHESGAEMARLLDQDRIYTRNMGGFFVERSDLSQINHILDIGCGPGGWVQELAFTYPEKDIVGCDISQAMIEHARAQAKIQRLENAHFHVMDMTRPLAFADNSFDLVNARLIAFLAPQQWTQLLQECVRITRPGGIIRLTECQAPAHTNSLAIEKLVGFFALSLYRAGQSFSPDGRQIGILPVLSGLLSRAGYVNIGHWAHLIDFSAGEEEHDPFCADLKVAIKLGQPFMLAAQVATQEEMDQLYEQMEVDMLREDFGGIQLFATVWGEKPYPVTK